MFFGKRASKKREPRLTLFDLRRTSRSPKDELGQGSSDREGPDTSRNVPEGAQQEGEGALNLAEEETLQAWIDRLSQRITSAEAAQVWRWSREPGRPPLMFLPGAVGNLPRSGQGRASSGCSGEFSEGWHSATTWQRWH